MLVDRWDKIDTEQDLIDYQVNIDMKNHRFGGDLGMIKNLPNPELVTDNNFNSVDGYNYYNGYMILDEIFPKEY